MAAKKPSIKKQLADLKNAHAALHSDAEKLRKDLESAKNYQKWAEQARDNANGELAQVHAFFDAMGEQTVARKVPAEYGQTENSAMTRLSVFLANRK